ncbi:MAG: ABC transporter permease [Deltaproteobacteria bacterium]|nr:ABC transporter permease [Deltaproteobacteria bacterium]
MRRTGAIIWKEFLHILRDPKTLALIVIMPVMQLTIYGYAINTDVKHMSTIVFNEDQTPLSRRLIDSLVESSYFDIEFEAKSLKDISDSLDLGKAKVGFHIPPHFAQDMLSGKGTQLQLLIDGTDSNPANTAMNTSQALINNFLLKEKILPVATVPLQYRPRMWYNPDLKSSYFFIPGVVGLLLQLLIPMITGTAVVREKERGNLEQLLVTPIRPYELILGKLIPYLMIGLVIATTVLVAARFLFDLPVRGSPLLLFLLTSLYLMVCLGLGLLASTIADNQQQAAQIIMFFAAPSVLLSGFIFPRENMPYLIHLIGYGIPLTFFVKIIRGILLKGLHFYQLFTESGALMLMAILALGFSILKFKKRLK